MQARRTECRPPREADAVVEKTRCKTNEGVPGAGAGAGAQTPSESVARRQLSEPARAAGAEHVHGEVLCSLLRLVCKQLDWREENLGNDKGTVFWLVSNEDIAARLPRRKPSQRVAWYAGMYELCKKVPLHA